MFIVDLRVFLHLPHVVSEESGEPPTELVNRLGWSLPTAQVKRVPFTEAGPSATQGLSSRLTQELPRNNYSRQAELTATCQLPKSYGTRQN